MKFLLKRAATSGAHNPPYEFPQKLILFDLEEVENGGKDDSQCSPKCQTALALATVVLVVLKGSWLGKVPQVVRGSVAATAVLLLNSNGVIISEVRLNVPLTRLS